MSKVSSTHIELTRFVRGEAKKLAGDTEYEVSGEVRHYHRKDGYRVVDVCSADHPFLVALKKVVDDHLVETNPSSRVFTIIEKGLREFHLSVSIWPQ